MKLLLSHIYFPGRKGTRQKSRGRDHFGYETEEETLRRSRHDQTLELRKESRAEDKVREGVW